MGTGGEMGTQFFFCAMGCAMDDNCVGITVSASSCQEHQGDRDAAQYKRQVIQVVYAILLSLLVGGVAVAQW